MAEIDLIEQIKISKQFPRRFDDYFNYFIPLLGGCLAGLSTWGLMTTPGLLKMYFFFFTCFSLALLALSLIRLNDNIKFKTVFLKPTISPDNIADVFIQCFRINSINVQKEIGKIEAFTKTSLFSWGEKITVIITHQGVLINSRPSAIRQAFTIFEDRKNIRKLTRLLKESNPERT